MPLSTIPFSGLGADASNQGVNFRNLIINGDMSIDQRNTTSTINATGVTYNVDRFLGRGVSSAGVFTLVQDTDAPERFTNSLKATVTTADSSIASGSSYRVQHFVEGNNSANLYWGNSSAQTVTLSFYVKSSVTGTFGGNLANGDFNRFNVFSYTINSANTWERKTINITGDTSGTWSTNNTLAIRINWSLGAGSSLLDSAGSWGSSTKEGVSGQTNLIATNSATWQITGVQLEVGTSASDFEFLPFDVNLQRCQRYYHQIGHGLNGANGTVNAGQGQWYNSGEVTLTVYFPTSMRATPSMTSPTVSSGYRFHKGGSYSDVSDGGSINSPSNMMTGIYKSGLSGGTGGHASFLAMIASGASYKFDSEL